MPSGMHKAMATTVTHNEPTSAGRKPKDGFLLVGYQSVPEIISHRPTSVMALIGVEHEEHRDRGEDDDRRDAAEADEPGDDAFGRPAYRRAAAAPSLVGGVCHAALLAQGHEALLLDDLLALGAQNPVDVGLLNVGRLAVAVHVEAAGEHVGCRRARSRATPPSRRSRAP